MRRLRGPALALALAAAACARPSLAGSASPARGLYIGDVASALVDGREDELLDRVRRGRFTHLVLYGLGRVFPQEDAAARLARFIARARREAGVRSVAAPIAGADRIRQVVDFVTRHPEAAFDAMVTEDEYWLRCAVRRATGAGERADCFPPFVRLLEKLRAAAGGRMRVGAYLGYPTADEARRIAGLVDDVFLNYHVSDPRRAWAHVHPHGGALSERIRRFAGLGVEVWPIFYIQGETDMGGWLRRHGLRAAERAFLADMGAEVKARLGGFQFFARDIAAAGALPP